MSYNSSPGPPGVLLHESPWKVNRRVISALLMRELLTRYGRNNIGFLWLFIEPIIFIGVITVIWSAFRSVHGSSLPIVAFALTGYSALLLWRNMAGRCIEALQSNMSLLFHRQVKIQDVYLARIILELMAASTAFVTLGVGLYALNWITPPEDALQVLGGWLLLTWFGAGLALTLGGLSEKYKVVARLWHPLSYVLLVLSGVGFIVDALPPRAQEIVLWLPMVNALEYLREGWFGSLLRAHYDIPYVIFANLLLTFFGLTLVRQIGLDASVE